MDTSGPAPAADAEREADREAFAVLVRAWLRAMFERGD